MALPTTISGIYWPNDGIAYLGPFISSLGNVYVVGGMVSSSTSADIWKATDPTSSFTSIGGIVGTGSTSLESISACQFGDTLYVAVQEAASGGVAHRPYNMATDTAGTSRVHSSGVPINGGVAIARRSTGSDVILFHNVAGVVNMGKTYGRVQAVRYAGGVTAGALTDIGIGSAATTQQAESVDSAILTSSDRVQLLWTRGNATAGSPSDIYGRCVKSSDNLDGTSPATAEYRAAPINGVRSSVAVDDAMHLSGQPFFSGSTLAIPYIDNSAKQSLITGTDADSMTFVNWGSISTNAISALAAGTSDAVARIGGSPWDGSNKNVVWIDAALADPMYDKDTFGTDQTIEATTATFVSANVYQRGSSVVLAVIYDKAGTWVYNEVVLRTVASAPMPVQPMIPTLAVSQSSSM